MIYIVYTFTMQGKIVKWGNSLAIRIPAKVAVRLGIKVGDVFNMDVKDGMLIMTPVPKDILPK